ncbi:hypothetical protein HU763_005210 [Pseudomonas anuradhapurensis]|uniref:hypothetical protein n=1 Tax=Pseudomonas anuradhapurensis TaxID=485870 RepID=UPI0016485048|nr:hypothetical protein [Pseudomonas anuradhapurensis]QXI48856.1 hypothetical protein HU763_005210 [Pseudomonas anuradhapurensis]
MLDRFGRDTSHLRDSQEEHPAEFATGCIASVEDLFGAEWLEGQEGKEQHRLQALWKRKDWLSTCELFGLGKCIQELAPKHAGWLRQTAKKVKSGVANAHGFTTEILTCGSIKSQQGEVAPAKGNQKGYDLQVEFPSGFKYYVSIKNQGLTSHEAAFHQYGDRLKAAFDQRLRVLKLDGELYLESDTHIEPETFERLIKFVGDVLQRPDTYTLKGSSLTFKVMPRSRDPRASTFRSSQVSMLCPQHRNALRNAETRLKEAAENMGAHLKYSDDYFRYLWIRVHSSIEVAVLKQAAESMLTDDAQDYGFDGVFFVQPSVVRQGSNSVINTYFDVAIANRHPGFIKALQEGKIGLLTLDTPVGRLSQEPSELQLTNGPLSPPVPPRHYFYQKADIYVLMQRDGEDMVGEWASPASGIRHHLVYRDGAREVLFPSPSVEVEETLII